MSKTITHGCALSIWVPVLSRATRVGRRETYFLTFIQASIFIHCRRKHVYRPLKAIFWGVHLGGVWSNLAVLAFLISWQCSGAILDRGSWDWTRSCSVQAQCPTCDTISLSPKHLKTLNYLHQLLVCMYTKYWLYFMCSWKLFWLKLEKIRHCWLTILLSIVFLAYNFPILHTSIVYPSLKPLPFFLSLCIKASFPL